MGLGRIQMWLATAMGAPALFAAFVPSALATDFSLSLVANLKPFCQFKAITIAPGQPNIQVHSTSTSISILEIGSPIDLATGNLTGASFTASLTGLCNFTSRVVLVSRNGGLKAEAEIPSRSDVPGRASPLASRIDYAASARWMGLSVAELVTDGTPGATSVGNVTPVTGNGNVVVNFSIDANPAVVPAAGTYADILFVRLEPQ